jgi:hypothetical protein
MVEEEEEEMSSKGSKIVDVEFLQFRISWSDRLPRCSGTEDLLRKLSPAALSSPDKTVEKVALI